MKLRDNQVNIYLKSEIHGRLGPKWTNVWDRGAIDILILK